MSKLLENAVISIRLGIEDYQSEDEGRKVSSIRNIHAGVLLLGKQCLLKKAPEAEIWQVLAADYEPRPDGKGGVTIKPRETRTIDFRGLRKRFKDFDIKWPKNPHNYKALNKIRNDLEHLYSDVSKERMQEAIAGIFPLVGGFLDILEEDPAKLLKESWQVMIQETGFYNQLKSECNESFKQLSWGDPLVLADKMQCPNCSSSLICQVDGENGDPAYIEGKCQACGQQLTAEQTVEIVVKARYGFKDYRAFKDGGENVIHQCPECYNTTYVDDYDTETNHCYFCEYEVCGTCNLCGEELTVSNQSIDNSSYCDYCNYQWDKIMNED